MKRQYRKYTDEDVINTAKKATSLNGMLKELGLRQAGGNFCNMKRILQKLNVDTSHWTGQAWNRGQQLKDWSDYTHASSAKSHLIKARGHKCEDCDRTKWKKQDIPLEIHHIDGDRTNNAYENLQLLCPNCHATTESWRRQKTAR